MKKNAFQNHRNIVGLLLIVVAVTMLLYDFFSPPVGELSNFTLVVFAKIIAIAGSLLNININLVSSGDTPAKEQSDIA